MSGLDISQEHSHGFARKGRLATPTVTRTSHDGILVFEYVESGLGGTPLECRTDHCVIIPVQETPIRVISEREGRTERFTLGNGDIALAHAGMLTSWQWLDPADVVIIHIHSDVFRHFVEAELKVFLRGSLLVGQLVIHDPELRRAADMMRQTLMSADLGAGVVFDALARVFLVHLVKRYGKQSPVSGKFDAKFGMTQYTKLVSFIETHLDTKITPAVLASEVGMSEAAFARKFKKKAGQTPMRFVAQLRLEAAIRMLADDALNLAEIAARCGFSDQAHLSRNFKAAHGISPSQYRATR